MSDDELLLDALDARTGLVCFVGAGGKKTTLYRLAGAHPGRVGMTATVHIPFFPGEWDAARVIASDVEILPAVRSKLVHHDKVAFAHPSNKRGRFAGLAPTLVGRIQAEVEFDLILVKADGARSRWIKAPNSVEPQIPKDARVVIPVISARAIGEVLTERIAHRLDHIESVCGVEPGQTITPGQVARLLSHEQGALRGIGDARVIPLINMVDDERSRTLAVDTARQALAQCDRFDRVVLASMRRAQPLIEVVER